MSVKPSKFAPPYRPPCAGFWTTWHGCAEQSKESDKNYLIYENVTKVPDPNVADADPIGPYARVSCDVDTTAYVLDPRCGQYATIPPLTCAGDVLTVIDNCYKATDPKQYRDFSACHKYGFKNLQAWKTWHGTWPFTLQGNGLPCSIDNSPDCPYVPPMPAPMLTKYRTSTITATIVSNDGTGFTTQLGTSTQTYSLTKSVDKFGNVTKIETGHTIAKTIAGDGTETVTTDADTGAPSQLGFLQRCLAAGTVHLPMGNDYFVQEGDVTVTRSDTVLTVHFEPSPATYGYRILPPACDGGTGGWYSDPEQPFCFDSETGTILDTVALGTVVDMTWTLSDPYTSDDVNADCDALFAAWAGWQTNDALYPWRLDEDVTIAPLLHYKEPYTEVDPSLDDPDLTVTYTSDIVGGPLPVGYDAYWDFRYENYLWDDTDALWILESFGSRSPIPHATNWTNARYGLALWGGKWAHGGTIPDAKNGNPLPFGTLMKQQFVQAMLFVKPSHNFARPCGSVDRCAIDQTTIDCDSNPTGDLRWPNKPCNCNDASQTAGPTPTDCPDDSDCAPVAGIFKWDDNTIKGDYIQRDFTYDFRDVGEIARLRTQYEYWRDVLTGCDLSVLTYPDVIRSGAALKNISVTQKCAIFQACNPVVIGDGDPLHLDIDELYTSFVYQDARQWMIDPLWQLPVVACADRDTKENRVDDGSCGQSGPELDAAAHADKEIVWILPPYEEARCTLSTIIGDAPDLPAGVRIGCVNTGTADAPVWSGPECDEPSATILCPWAVWNRQLTFNCDEVVDFEP